MRNRTITKARKHESAKSDQNVCSSFVFSCLLLPLRGRRLRTRDYFFVFLMLWALPAIADDYHLQAPAVDRLFANLDANVDSKLSSAEWEPWARNGQVGVEEPDGPTILWSMGYNSGSSETRFLAEARPEERRVLSERALAQADADQDGAVTQSEFNTWVRDRAGWKFSLVTLPPAPAQTAPAETPPVFDPSTPGTAEPRSGDLLESIRESVRDSLLALIQSADARGDRLQTDVLRERLIQVEIRFATAHLYAQAGRVEEAVAELRPLLATGLGTTNTTPAPEASTPAKPQAAGIPAPAIEPSQDMVRLPVQVRVQGPGYFRVIFSGEDAYVRAGYLAADLGGCLKMIGREQGVWGTPLILLPSICVDSSATRLIVNPDGSVQVRTSKGETPYVGQITLVVFQRPEALELGGSLGGLDLYFESPGSGPAVQYTPGPGSPAGSVVYGSE